ncbi:ATP-binding cassette subfamily C protein [Brevundimonas nasdae]|uniref:type I secretion system permease/ATPase n=1 Tax=Brevundimonas nasdae TaxID=172043 RepID=UPI0019120B2E|nr:type I secretion system permease/ATPase [Brevundimonas nasdae]MBK6026752.1 type I secretion system permease/ATPase [Brevundimonas nasdae]MDQ0453499.1 ATP-binding cassette subfamily C protein [Brevundimonas nasdae]
MLKLFFPTRAGAEPLSEALQACRRHLLTAALFSALVNILYLTPTLYMMQVYDRVVPTGGVTTLLLVSTAALFALLSLAALDWLRGRVLLRAALRLDRLLAPVILTRVVDAPSQLARSQALREFDNVRSALSGQGALALLDAPWTPLYLACCFLLHPAIGVLTLVGGICLFVLAWLNERESRARLARSMQSSAAAYVSQEAVAAQAEVVRALGMRGSSVARQVDQRRLAVGQQADAQLTGGKYSGAIKFVRLALQSTALGLSAWLVVQGQMSAGSIIASSVLLSRAVAPVELLVGAWPALIQARTSWKVLVDLFVGTAAQTRDRTSLPTPVGKLALEGIGVRLPETERPQLNNIGLRLEPGQTLGVIGASGSGKTTLARVIAGGLKPDQGSVRLDGADYDARDGDVLARYIGYLPQTPSLFAGSIRDNISRFAAASGEDAEAVDQAVVRAAVAAGVHELIQRLPQGYDMVLGPYGAGVSAGQAQRIALARALYRDPVLLVLDEPNSNLDQEGETALMAAILAAAHRGAAVVIVAHRAGVLARVDRLMVMRDGAVQVEGAREEVLAKLRSAKAPAGKPETGADFG